MVSSCEFPRPTDLIERHLADDVKGFLATHGLTKDDIGAWVTHPGGPKVINAITKTLETTRGGARTDLALAGRHRQPLVGVGAAHFAGHHRQTAPQRKPWADACDGPRVLDRAGATALALSRGDRHGESGLGHCAAGRWADAGDAVAGRYRRDSYVGRRRRWSAIQGKGNPAVSGSARDVSGVMSIGHSSSLPLWNTAPARTRATRCRARASGSVRRSSACKPRQFRRRASRGLW